MTTTMYGAAMRVHRGLLRAVIACWRFFAEHPEATLLELCNAIGITKSMADRDVKALKQDGRLKREGSSFAGYWRVLS